MYLQENTVVMFSTEIDIPALRRQYAADPQLLFLGLIGMTVTMDIDSAGPIMIPVRGFAFSQVIRLELNNKSTPGSDRMSDRTIESGHNMNVLIVSLMSLFAQSEGHSTLIMSCSCADKDLGSCKSSPALSRTRSLTVIFLRHADAHEQLDQRTS